MKRSRPLRADPEKVREFMQRGRGKLKRAEVERKASSAKRGFGAGTSGGDAKVLPTRVRDADTSTHQAQDAPQGET